MNYKRDFFVVVLLLCFCNYLVFTDEILLNENSGLFSPANITNQTNVIWHLILNDACEINLEVRRLLFGDECDVIAVSAGPNQLDGSKSLLLTEDTNDPKVTKTMIIKHYEAYVTPYIENESTIDYEFFYNCFITVEDAMNMTAIPTPFHAEDNYTISICLIDLNSTTVESLLDKDNATQKDLLEAIANLANADCFQIEGCECPIETEVHLHWPLFVQRDCKQSSKVLSISDRFCVCFNLSIEIINGKNCKHDFLTNGELNKLFKGQDEISVGGDSYQMVVLREDNKTLYIWISVFSLAIGLTLCYAVYKYAPILTNDKTPIYDSRGSEFEEEVAKFESPTEIGNPVYISSSFSEPDAIGRGGIVNSAFVDDNDHPPPSASARFQNRIHLSIKSLPKQTTVLNDITEDEEDYYGYNSRSPTISFGDLYERIEDVQFDKSVPDVEGETKL